MKKFTPLRAPRVAKRPQTLLFSAMIVLSASLSFAAVAQEREMDAKLAITRAQAKIDIVSKENPAATQNLTFVNAQQKLVAANAAMGRNNDRQAVWFANEAELFADATAAASKLAGLERTRSEVARDVDILEAELRKQ